MEINRMTVKEKKLLFSFCQFAIVVMRNEELPALRGTDHSRLIKHITEAEAIIQKFRKEKRRKKPCS